MVGEAPSRANHASLTVPTGSDKSSDISELSDSDCSGDECDTDDESGDSTGVDKESQSILDEALNFCDLSQTLWQKGELDNALEVLDKAYALIVEIDPQQESKLIQQKDDLRFLISKRILEIYASRNIVVNGDHDEIPMEMNSHIEAEINLFTGAEKNFFMESYQRSGMYRPYIVQALKEAGLPEELSWLPLIESGFKVKALSGARALGLWQFIPSTGYKFGLKRTMYVDERIDFIKSTHAAIAYLKELHNIFGDWATVLAAYNCGEGRVLRVIRTQNVNYLDNFWDLYQRLPRETARYVPRFFAVLNMIKNTEKYGLDQLPLHPPINFEEVEVNRQAHLKDICKALDVDLAALETLNPELRYQILPPENYALRIPEGLSSDSLANLELVPTCSLPQKSYIWHRVRRGESLGTIARRYKISVRSIMEVNNLRSARYLRSGSRLKIPHSEATATPSRASTGAISSSGVHTVAKGDSLWNIARKYDVTVKQIMSLNNLSSSTLSIGQKLKIPASSELAESNKLQAYYVRQGDTPTAIAQRHNMGLSDFLRINQLNSHSTIFPGQKVYIE